MKLIGRSSKVVPRDPISVRHKPAVTTKDYFTIFVCLFLIFFFSYTIIDETAEVSLQSSLDYDFTPNVESSVAYRRTCALQHCAHIKCHSTFESHKRDSC